MYVPPNNDVPETPDRANHRYLIIFRKVMKSIFIFDVMVTFGKRISLQKLLAFICTRNNFNFT